MGNTGITTKWSQPSGILQSVKVDRHINVYDNTMSCSIRQGIPLHTSLGGLYCLLPSVLPFLTSQSSRNIQNTKNVAPPQNEFHTSNEPSTLQGNFVFCISVLLPPLPLVTAPSLKPISLSEATRFPMTPSISFSCCHYFAQVWALDQNQDNKKLP